MRRTFLKGNISIVGVKKFNGNEKTIDYYLRTGNGDLYAFSRIYTKSTYKLCKGGMSVNDLAVLRSRDTSVMALVKKVNYMIGYLADYYELPVETI